MSDEHGFLPEDADERRMFDEAAATLGGPLRAVAACLTVWAKASSPGGSYGKGCAIMANEVRRVAERSDPHGKCAAEITKLRTALEACRQHVRHNHNSGSWWNDPRVYKLMKEHIDPALGTDTRE